MFFLVSLKCLLRRPLVSICFTILLASVTIALLVGVTLTLITVRGYADAENTYVTRVSLAQKVQEAVIEKEPDIPYMEEITIPQKELEPFRQSPYVKEASEPFYVPISTTLLSFNNVTGDFYNVGAVVKITGIETTDLANPENNRELPKRLTLVSYETIHAFFGGHLMNSYIAFLDYDESYPWYNNEPPASEKIRSIIEIGKTYLIKADTTFINYGWYTGWGFVHNPDIVPEEVLEKTLYINSLLFCGVTMPISDRFIPMDVTTAEEAENHPLVQQARRYQYNFSDWPNGLMHMSLALVENLENTRPFYNRDLILTNGRYFTEEEMQNGDAVIIIGEDTLTFSKAEVGDKIKIMLNQSNAFITDYQEYEIIGVYKSGNDYEQMTQSAVGPYTGNPETYEYNGKAYVQRWQSHNSIVYMPKASVKNDPLIEEYVANNRITRPDGEALVMLEDFYFILKNNRDIHAFLEELESSAYITENYDIQYSDQGYSQAVENLDQLRVTSVVIITAAFLVTGVTAAFLMLLFVSRRSRDVIIMMALGTKKRDVCAMLAWGLLLMYAISCGGGLLIGGSIVGQVVEAVVSPLYAVEEFPQFLLNPMPLIPPELNTVIPYLVYYVTAGLLLAVLAVSFTVSVVGRLRMKPSDALSESVK